MGKLRASEGGLDDARNWATLAAIRVPNRISLEGDISPTISPELQEKPGQPMGAQNGPFLLANRSRGLPNYG